MTQTLTATCPTCKAQISEDDRTCAHCGASVSVWTETPGRAPLILPGNTGLSADMFRGKVSPVRVLGGTAVGAAILVVALFMSRTPADEDEAPATPVPTRITSTVFADTTPLRDAIARQQQDVAPVTTVPAAATPPAPAPVEAAPAPVAPARVNPPPVAAAPVAAVPVVTPTPPAIDARTMNAVLRMLPVVSDTLRPGEQMQLRWAMRDRTTNRAVPVPMPVEFTSTNANVLFVERRTGAVTAVNPGTARIIADGGRAGQFSLTLVVRAVPQAPVVATRPTPAPVIPANTPPAVAPPVAPPVSAPPVAVATPAPAPTPAREERRAELPNSDEIRGVVDRFIGSVRSGSVRSFELNQFMADGDGHKVTLASGPSTVSSTLYNVRVTFEVRLSKYDAAGRPVTRLASVSMDLDKRDSGVSSSAVAIGALRRP